MVMKKFFLLTLIAFFGAASAHAAGKATREDYVRRVETCEAILQEFMSDPSTAIPPMVWQKAHGLVILNQFKGGFFLGVKDGYGVMMVKKPDGQWSVPALIQAGETSLGLQFGAKSIETVMIFTDDQTPRLLFKQRFNVGVDAKAVAGPKAAEAEKDNHQIIDAPVLVYTKTKGLFAGATVKVGYLSRNDEANFVLYHTTYTLPEILYSDWVQPVPEVQFLMNYVKRFAP